jgi:hypothetical protein
LTNKLMHKKNIMQGQTHQQYHLKINIFLFLKINCICIKHTKRKILNELV